MAGRSGKNSEPLAQRGWALFEALEVLGFCPWLESFLAGQTTARRQSGPSPQRDHPGRLPRTEQEITGGERAPMLAWTSLRAHRPAHEGQGACTTETVSSGKAKPGRMHSATHRLPWCRNLQCWQPMGCLHTAGGTGAAWSGRRVGKEFASPRQPNGSRDATRHSWQQPHLCQGLVQSQGPAAGKPGALGSCVRRMARDRRGTKWGAASVLVLRPSSRPESNA